MSEQAPQRRLELVHEAPEIPGFDWEITAENVQVLVARIAELEQLRVSAENRLRGADLRIAGLEADRAAAAKAHPLRPHVELVWRCWKKACRRRRELTTEDREKTALAIEHYGLEFVLRAVAGASHDPFISKPGRNGRRERYDKLSLIVREYAQVASFARRAPLGWAPKIDKLAAIGGTSEDWVAQALVPTEKQKAMIEAELGGDG